MVDSLERRRATRANVVIPVEVREGSDFSLHSTKDLSAGGVYFDRAIPHAVGSRVQLSFELPGDPRSIHCSGEVANVPDSSSYGMGIRFLDVSPPDAQRIEAFLKELQERK